MTCRTALARLALALAAALSIACVTRPPLTCPERGGPAWSEITSPHFVLRTDLDPGAARSLFAELDGLYQALAHVMPRPRRAPAVKLEVVVLARQEDYAALFGPPPWPAGFFTQKLWADFEPQPIMVYYDDARVERTTVFLHELAHRFLRERFASLPTWLDEGLAQLYSTIRVASDRVVVGERRPAAYVDFAELPFWEGAAYESAHGLRVPLPAPVATAPSLSELLGAGERELRFPFRGRTPELFYAAAWRFTHLLLTRKRRRFEAFLDDLERGESERGAFDRAFGDDLARLSAAYVEQLGREQLPTFDVAYRPPPEAPREHHLMRDAAVHLLWARLRPRGDLAEEAAVQDLDEVLAGTSGSAEARYLIARRYVRQGREDDAVRELDAALATRPEDPRYLYARLVARPPRAPLDAEALELLERLSRVARSAAQLDCLADAYGITGDRVNEGLVFADRALRADPMCWWCEKTRSRILFSGGRYTEAVVAADRALALLPDRSLSAGLRSERAFLARLRDADRAAPSVAAASPAPR